jgi:hypothetical protein
MLHPFPNEYTYLYNILYGKKKVLTITARVREEALEKALLQLSAYNQNIDKTKLKAVKL